MDIIRPTALPHAARLAASGLLLTALVVPSAALATSAPPAADPGQALAAPGRAPGTLPLGPQGLTSTTLSKSVTDDAKLLDNSDAEAAVAKVKEETGLHLWVVTIADSSRKAAEFAESAWKATGLGASDVILVINVPDSGSNSFLFRADPSGVLSQGDQVSIADSLKPYLKKKDFNKAVAALPSLIKTQVAGAGTTGDRGATRSTSAGSGALSTSSTDSGPGVGTALLAGGAVAGAGAGGWWVLRRRRQKDGSATVTGAPTPKSIEQLQTQAVDALVAADDAVRAADEELSYAQAQFGLAATDAFSAALGTAREHVTASFEIRKVLEDDVPETPRQQWEMYSEILSRSQAAVAAIREQEKAFNERRGLEANLPASIAETTQRADETEQAILQADTLLTTLRATYPDSALTSVAAAPRQARRLLEAGRTALDQAQASVDAGQQGTAVEQVRIAQGAIAQAGTLATQVTGARERLERAASDLTAAIGSLSSDLVDARRLSSIIPAATLDPLVADAEAAIAAGRAASGMNATGDPLAALDHLTRAEAAIDAALAPAREREENDSRARTALGSRLSRLNSQVDAVTSYITTNRGVVGPAARTALSEASRHAAAATQVQADDPAAALAEVEAGEPLAAQAQTLAESDVRNSSYGSGGYRSGGRLLGGGGGGLDLGSLVLGGLLLGGLGGGHHEHHHHHWDDDGPGFGGFGGGGFGGFGGGGGDFGGGGGDFDFGGGDFGGGGDDFGGGDFGGGGDDF